MTKRSKEILRGLLGFLRVVLGVIPLALILIYGSFNLVTVYTLVGLVLFIFFRYKRMLPSPNWFSDLVLLLIIWPVVVLLWNEFYKPKPETLLDELKETPTYQNMEKVHDLMQELCVDGTDQDVVPDGYGEFGYSQTNPIPVNTITGSIAYLALLRTLNDEKVQYERVASTSSTNINGMIDIYDISINNENITTLFISPYNKKNSKKAPKGFRLLQLFPETDVSDKENKEEFNIEYNFVEEIEKLIDIQIEQEPFLSMNLSNNEILRAKVSLAIFNFAYIIFFVNSFLTTNNSKVKTIIDEIYDEFFQKIKQKYSHTTISISDILVEKNEQIEIIEIAKEWGITYDVEVFTLLHNLFPFIYQYRIPKYLNLIEESFKRAENDIAFPFIDLITLFNEQFLDEPNSDFSGKFYLNINTRTINKIADIVESKIQGNKIAS